MVGTHRLAAREGDHDTTHIADHPTSRHHRAGVGTGRRRGLRRRHAGPPGPVRPGEPQRQPDHLPHDPLRVPGGGPPLPLRGPAPGACGVREGCTGQRPSGPPDARQQNGAVCRPGTGVCDPAETCDGVNVACPPDAFAPDGTPCNDGSACTDNDACFRGACVGTTNVDACLDDFYCYKTKPSAGESRFTPVTGVHLVDQFDDLHFDVVKPRFLCPPADKNSQGIVDPATHLRAYAIRAVRGTPRYSPRTNILVTNQLGDIHVNTIRPDLLLVPAAKSLTAPPSPPAPGRPA